MDCAGFRASDWDEGEAYGRHLQPSSNVGDAVARQWHRPPSPPPCYPHLNKINPRRGIRGRLLTALMRQTCRDAFVAQTPTFGLQ